MASDVDETEFKISTPSLIRLEGIALLVITFAYLIISAYSMTQYFASSLVNAVVE